MEIKYVFSREEVAGVLEEFVINTYFNSAVPGGMEVKVLLESYGDTKVIICEKEACRGEW